MIFQTLHDFISLKEHSRNLRLMGFDIGQRRIGVSVSDSTWTIASPVGVVDLKNAFQPQLTGFLKQFPVFSNGAMSSPPHHSFHSYGICGFIVGYPLLLNGDQGSQAQKVIEFTEKNLLPFNIPILLWDERLSTHGANRILLQADMSREKRKNTIDKMAAVFILQGFLDRLKS